MLGRLVPAGTFRLAAGFAVAVAVMLVLLTRWLWGVTAGFVEEHLERLIISESQAVHAGLRDTDRQRLVDSINRRYRDQPVVSRVILLADEHYRLLAGNLEAWPEGVGQRTGWHLMQVARDGESSEMRVMHEVLSDGSHLLLGYDLTDYYAGRQSFFVLLLGLSAPMLLAMLLFGLLVRRALLAQVASINTTASAIVRGNLKERIRERGRNSEFDLLARTINRMLDHIEGLVAGIANVSNSIAHDLRTPLAETRSRLDDLLEKLPPDDDRRAEVAAGIDDIDRLIGILESLLRLAQIESGARRSGFVHMDLCKVAGSVAELYEVAAEHRQLTFSVELPGAVPMHGDPSLMAQAIGNLIDNAIKYTPQRGRVGLTVASQADGSIQVRVDDNGPGISAAERGRAATLFFRGEAAAAVPGTGLGLSLAAAIATLHGGELQLQDNGPGLRAILVLDSGADARRSHG